MTKFKNFVDDVERHRKFMPERSKTLAVVDFVKHRSGLCTVYGYIDPDTRTQDIVAWNVFTGEVSTCGVRKL